MISIKNKSKAKKEAEVKRVAALEARRNHGSDRLAELRKKVFADHLDT